MLSNGYSFTQSILSEIQVPQKGILSHTLYNDEQAKIILFGFAAGEELTSHTAPMPATIVVTILPFRLECKLQSQRRLFELEDEDL